MLTLYFIYIKSLITPLSHFCSRRGATPPCVTPCKLPLAAHADQRTHARQTARACGVYAHASKR